MQTRTEHYRSCTDPDNCWCEVRRYALLLGYAVAILTGEIIGGLYSESLALLADAGHVFADSTAIIVSIAVAICAKQGYGEESRVRSIGFWINMALLALVVWFIVHEAMARIEQPRTIVSWVMVIVAALGAFGNWLQHRELEKVHNHNRHQTHRALSVHIKSDLALSVGVVVGGLLIWTTGWMILDLLISLTIAVWILRMMWRLIKNPHGGHHH